jgi:serine/threonine protein phosphatase PrpC
MISDQEIASIVKKSQPKIDDLPGQLIAAANAAGGRDNITVLLCEVRK